MCGIAGIIRWNRAASHAEIERMTGCVRHRGPDGAGFLVRDGVALGHRRLAIIDLEGGQQPMSNEDGTVWVTYNGEIYNFQPLRDELIAKGHQFATRCDTEVIVHAYEEWGAQCVQHFRGMFTFGLVDFKKQKLLLARDHFGIKPLVYRVGKNYLAFASELTALRNVDDEAPIGSLQAVDFFLRYQYIPAPHTIYHDVYKLPPAHVMECSLSGELAEPHRYWDLQFKPETGVREEEWEERAEAVIKESVSAHLVSDVPFGVFLSGGIDSTLVALQMSQLLQRPLQAFSIGFEESEYSELSYARQATEHFGVELHTEVIREDALQILPSLMKHYGEPFGDASAVPTWLVSKLARSRVPMVLSGDGGDEAFGGYNSYLGWMTSGADLHALVHAARLMKVRRPRAALRTVFRAIQRQILGPHPIPRHSLAEWQDIMMYVGAPGRRALWKRDYHSRIQTPDGLYEQAAQHGQQWDRLGFAQYMDFRTYLPGVILTKVDIASMFHGLEVRTPLVDLRVVEFAASLPMEQRQRVAPENQKLAGKYLLKKMVAKEISPEFAFRTKQGFSIPRAEWLWAGQVGQKMLNELLNDGSSSLHQWFEPAHVKKLTNEHNQTRDNSNALWLLLVMGLWLEQNRDITFR